MAIVLLAVGVLAVYPYYQYYVDPDGTAYLTIAQKYADVQWMRAVNGYWSPWSCWWTAILIRCGMEAIPASVVINSLGAAGFLAVTQSFFRVFGIRRRDQWLYLGAMALFLVYAVFAQSFDDLWECFFLLCTLRIVIEDGYAMKPVWWMVNGCVGALAYFAKAYAFPFFLLETVIFSWVLSRGSLGRYVKLVLVPLVCMMVVGFPWLLALHSKYGFWTYSTAGTLNSAWYLEGHPHWRDGIGALLPPAHPDSPWYWEDPWYANGYRPRVWDSWHLVYKQFLRLGYNVTRLFVSLFQLSVFSPVLFFLAWMGLRKRQFSRNVSMRLVVLMVVLFPLGYLLINFESRYIWCLLPLLVVIGNEWTVRQGRYRNLFPVAMALTMLFFPVHFLASHLYEGADEKEEAEVLKQHGIKGTFASMAHPGKEVQKMERLAYFSGNPFYGNTSAEPDTAQWYSDLGRYHVQYVINPAGAAGAAPEKLPPAHFKEALRLKTITVYAFLPQ